MLLVLRKRFLIISFVSFCIGASAQLTSYSLTEFNTSNTYNWSTAPWITSVSPSYPTGENAQASLTIETNPSGTVLVPSASLMITNDVSNLQISDLNITCESFDGVSSFTLTGNSITTNSFEAYIFGSTNNSASVAISIPLTASKSTINNFSTPLMLQQFTNLNTFTLTGSGAINSNNVFQNYGTLSISGSNAQNPTTFNVSGPNFVTGTSSGYEDIHSNIFLFGASQFQLNGTLNYSQPNEEAAIQFYVDDTYQNANQSLASNSYINITGTPTISSFGFYIGTNEPIFYIIATDKGVTNTKKQMQLMNFPEGFGTEFAINNNYSSPGLEVQNGYQANTVSIFDPNSLPNANKPSLVSDLTSPYHLVWSDISPQEWATISGSSNSYTGTGFSAYGLNGVFGLWVDVVQNHQTIAHTAGTNSPNNTATNLNTIKKSNQIQIQIENGLDNAELIKEQTVALNENIYSESLIAQQSMVQQLAERSLKTPVKHWSVYVEPRGSWGQIYKQKKHAGNTFQTAGTRAGFDYLWTNEKNQIPLCIGLGFVADYIHLWGQRKHHLGNFYSNESLGKIYLTVVPKAIRELSFNLIGGGGYSWYTFHRDLFENSKIIATGKSKGPEADFFFEIEYIFRHKRFSKIPKDLKIAPIAALQYTYSQINAYKESGAGRYNLKVNEQDASTLSTLFGFRTNYEFRSESSVSIRPELLFLWQYQYLDPSITSTSRYLTSEIGPNLITTTLPGLPRNTWIVGSNLRFDIYDCAQVQLDYDFLYNLGSVTNAFFLELKGKF